MVDGRTIMFDPFTNIQENMLTEAFQVQAFWAAF